MNISCVICSDLFVPTAEIYTTTCGHMFHFVCLMNWIERSKSCPQCRNKVTEQKIHRVYFNLANTDSNCEDVGTLINKIENIQFQLSLVSTETKNYKIKVNKLKRQNLSLREEVAKLESDAKSHDSAIHALKDQIRYFKSKLTEVDMLSAEIEKLKNTIRDMENIHLAMDGTREDFENMLKNENNIESLAIMAATLKKSLVEAERKKNDMEFKLRQARNEAKKYKQDYSGLDSLYSNLKREFEQQKINCDYEKQFLKNKISNLDKALVSRDDNLDITNTSIKRIMLESPVNYNRTPKLTQPIEIVDNNDASQPVPIDENEVITIQSDSESPYLPVKSSALGIDYSSFLNTSYQITSGNSIFKSGRKKLENVKLTESEVNYNGLGGSSKDDFFPSPKPMQTGLKRHKPSTKSSSHKFKKLAPIPGQAKIS